MKCPSCPVEMVIDHSKKVVEGDSSPDTPTKIYEQHFFVCGNPKCPQYKKVVAGEPILIFDSSVSQGSDERQIVTQDEKTGGAE